MLPARLLCVVSCVLSLKLLLKPLLMALLGFGKWCALMLFQPLARTALHSTWLHCNLLACCSLLLGM
jgi:hypothetical protein